MSKEIQKIVGEKEIVYSLESDNTWVIKSDEIDADTGAITISNPLLAKAIAKGDLLENWKVYVITADGYLRFILGLIDLGDSVIRFTFSNLNFDVIVLDYTLATGELEGTLTLHE